ncbi:Sterol 3-beta-glucosyltransferase [Seminavis robusta]|uniref:Sterol 3-beta-glucosyltransferase n=1 Tax=Seminavis robusta TaxID=568900 RepID=A0A9N8DNT9_9STRA|nr:Sterol 3-beta-glucosyltransferase [Seminavis robusta]|eukprot:Sro233_g094180.1 Sterol 3-beta-glucosyltransferase (458) ;mRNA; r:34288-35661
MRVLLLTIGSRGDVEPFCAIAKELLQQGHQVDFFVEPNWKFLIEPLTVTQEFGNVVSVSVHELPFSNASFSPNGASLQSLVDIQANYILPCFQRVCQVAKGCQCLVANSIASYLMVLVAIAENLPTILIHLQPLLPNQVFPSYRISPPNFCRAIQQYHSSLKEGAPIPYQPDYLFEINQNLYCALLQNGLLEKSCGIQPPMMSWEQMLPILSGCHPQFTIVNAYSNHLIPIMEGTPAVGPYVKDVGPLADGYISSNQDGLPDSVQSFLMRNDNTKPIAIGFGSMPVQQQQLDAVWQALQTLPDSQRVILIGKALTPPTPTHNNPQQWLHVTAIPYPLLLPHCSMMICHGGAGVLQACLRAGIPSLVCPVMGDQFALAAVVHTLQYGQKACRRFAELEAKDLIRGIRYLLQSTQISENCQQVAKRILVEQQEQQEVPTGPRKLLCIMKLAVEAHHSGE